MPLRPQTTTPEERGPYGVLFGAIDTGKTTFLAESFPDYAFLVTSGGALVNPRAWLRRRGKPVPANVIQLEDTIDAEGEPETDWHAETIRLFATLAAFARAARKEGKHGIPPTALQSWGIKLKSWTRGVVISEATTLMQWIDRDAKRTHGRNFPTNDRIKSILPMFAAWNLSTGLGLILDCHESPLEYEEGDLDREIPKSPHAPSWPFREMQRKFLQDVDFSWHLRNEVNDGKRSLIVRTRSDDSGIWTCRTRCPADADADKPAFTTDRTEVNLTDEGITGRDLLIEAGYRLPEIRRKAQPATKSLDTTSDEA